MDLQILTYPGLKPINWKKPPARDTRVASNIIAGNGLRFTASMRVVANMQHLIGRAPKALGYQIHIIQPPYSDGELSAGTHDFDYLLDVRPDRGILSIEDGFKLQNWLRRQGWMCWFRYTGSWASKSDWHVHGCPLPPDGHNFPTKVGEYVDGGLSQFKKIVTSSQIHDYWGHSLGLKGQHVSGMDNNKLTRYPKDIAGTIFDYQAWLVAKQKEMLK